MVLSIPSPSGALEISQIGARFYASKTGYLWLSLRYSMCGRNIFFKSIIYSHLGNKTEWTFYISRRSFVDFVRCRCCYLIKSYLNRHKKNCIKIRETGLKSKTFLSRFLTGFLWTSHNFRSNFVIPISNAMRKAKKNKRLKFCWEGEASVLKFKPSPKWALSFRISISH